jgi:hypothetical protein
LDKQKSGSKLGFDLEKEIRKEHLMTKRALALKAVG